MCTYVETAAIYKRYKDVTVVYIHTSVWRTQFLLLFSTNSNETEFIVGYTFTHLLDVEKG